MPSGTQHGDKLRLRGKGVFNMRRGVKGDQYVEIRVVIPRTLTPRQVRFWLDALVLCWQGRGGRAQQAFVVHGGCLAALRMLCLGTRGGTIAAASCTPPPHAASCVSSFMRRLPPCCCAMCRKSCCRSFKRKRSARGRPPLGAPSGFEGLSGGGLFESGPFESGLLERALVPAPVWHERLAVESVC